MNIDQIKQIKLQDFLATMGCKPVKQYGVNLMYLSPLRTEKHASFKVNTELNLWYDFGIGRGGNIIDLAELLYNSSDVSYLIHQIERNAPSCVLVSLPTVKPNTPQNSFENLQVLSITHSALIKYLGERCIDIEIARTVCKELHFDTRGKHYFGIGFPNIAGGYEIRNPFFKGCIVQLSKELGKSVTDASTLYNGYKDLNDYLCAESKHSEKAEIKKTKGIKF